MLVSEVYEEEEFVADVSAEIREKVNDMEKKYGVDIKIKEECDLGAAGYDFEYLLDEDMLLYNIEMLNSCMSKYPEGFFQQIKYSFSCFIDILFFFFCHCREQIKIKPCLSNYLYLFRILTLLYIYYSVPKSQQYMLHHYENSYKVSDFFVKTPRINGYFI